MSTDRESAGNRKKWILCLLYAPNSDGNSLPIYGTTRMMKACFLLHQKLEEEFEVTSGFEFRADKYGPLDPKVYEALDQLAKEEKIVRQPESEHDGQYDGVRYSLTDLGKEDAISYYELLSPNQQKLIRWVKYRRSMVPLGELLASVYSEYPSWTEESVLK